MYKAANRNVGTGESFAATIRRRDESKDFCLLDVPSLWGIPADVRKYDTLRVGENVYAIGAPDGLDLSMSAGLISQLRTDNGQREIQTDAVIAPGSSGGGLFDSKGNLIGLTTRVRKEAKNISFAISADLALEK